MGCHTNSREGQGTQIFSPLPCQCDRNEPKLISKRVMKKSVVYSDSTLMITLTDNFQRLQTLKTNTWANARIQKRKYCKFSRLLKEVCYGVYSQGLIFASEDTVLKRGVTTKETLTPPCSWWSCRSSEGNCLHCSQMLVLATSGVPPHYVPLPPCLPYWILQILSLLPGLGKNHEPPVYHGCNCDRWCASRRLIWKSK